MFVHCAQGSPRPATYRSPARCATLPCMILSGLLLPLKACDGFLTALGALGVAESGEWQNRQNPVLGAPVKAIEALFA